jgi:hypothetical protein
VLAHFAWGKKAAVFGEGRFPVGANEFRKKHEFTPVAVFYKEPLLKYGWGIVPKVFKLGDLDHSVVCQVVNGSVAGIDEPMLIALLNGFVVATEKGGVGDRTGEEFFRAREKWIP